MTIVSTENAEHYFWGIRCDGWHLVHTEHLSVIQERVPSGSGEVRHYHTKSEQFFYVLSGIATLEIEGIIVLLKSHEGVSVLPKQVHQLRNQHSEDLIFLVISTPPSHSDRVEA